MNLFEQLFESIFEKHQRKQADHERIMFDNEKELDRFDRFAAQFEQQLEQFAEYAEKRLGEEGNLPGIFK
ncbi:hypothetical protein ACINLD_01805 [Bacillus sp. z60-11]|uniref:hypothetical protein n=1 Tax=Bacillus sp. z60-11 TaxID=3377704 RepID=UPI00396C4ABD